MKIKTYSTSRIVTFFTVLFGLLLVTGCSREGEEPPAPLGDVVVLESLAESFTKISEQVDMNVRNMPLNEKRVFLEDVFRKSGYDYTKTLRTVGETRLDPFNKEQKDLVELLLFPTVGVPATDLSEIYSADELKAIEHMKGMF